MLALACLQTRATASCPPTSTASSVSGLGRCAGCCGVVMFVGAHPSALSVVWKHLAERLSAWPLCCSAMQPTSALLPCRGLPPCRRGCSPDICAHHPSCSRVLPPAGLHSGQAPAGPAHRIGAVAGWLGRLGRPESQHAPKYSRLLVDGLDGPYPSRSRREYWHSLAC